MNTKPIRHLGEGQHFLVKGNAICLNLFICFLALDLRISQPTNLTIHKEFLTMIKKANFFYLDQESRNQHITEIIQSNNMIERMQSEKLDICNAS